MTKLSTVWHKGPVGSLSASPRGPFLVDHTWCTHDHRFLWCGDLLIKTRMSLWLIIWICNQQAGREHPNFCTVGLLSSGYYLWFCSTVRATPRFKDLHVPNENQYQQTICQTWGVLQWTWNLLLCVCFKDLLLGFLIVVQVAELRRPSYPGLRRNLDHQPSPLLPRKM